ncbi:MAG: cold-shock protein, partial [Burkholderiales bacterium]
RRHEQKPHLSEPRGLVEKLFAEEGYGFIRTLEDNRQLYFHRNSVLHDDFGRLTVGTEVRFAPEEGEEGPQASSVQVLSKPVE